MICIYCDQEILSSDLKFYLAFEIPYFNLKVHRECWKIHKDTDFISENQEKILSYINKLSKNAKK